MTQAYPSKLTLELYELFASLLNPDPKTGRPRTVNLMHVLQATVYVLVTRCAWRLLPNEYPSYSTVYNSFRKWRDDGSWKRIHDQLVQWVRVSADYEATPSASSLDSQTVQTVRHGSSTGGLRRGQETQGAQTLYPSGYARIADYGAGGCRLRART